MRKTILSVGVIAVMLAASACGGGSSSDSASGDASGAAGGTFTISPVVDHSPWDLASASLGNDRTYYEAVYDTLLRTAVDGSPTPNLATSWTYDDSRTTLTLKLRTDVKFSDGTALDAEAVKANLLHNQKGTGEAASTLTGIKDVAAPDPSTVTITLTHADPGLLAALGTTPGMVASPKVLDSPSYATTPVGSGPYTLDAADSTEGSSYTFERNPDYWNKQAFPYDTIVIKPLFDPTAMLNALKSGDTDAGILSGGAAAVAPAKGAGLTVTLLPASTVNALYLWDRAGTINPALGNLKVRQALNYAFDRSAIANVTGPDGLSVATVQPFSPVTSGYDPTLEGAYPFDVTKAKQLLAEGGYPDGFTLTLPAVSGTETQGLFPIVKQALGDIGVTVQYEGVPVDQYISNILGGKYAASIFPLGGTSSIVIGQQVAPTAPFNPLHYSSTDMDALLANLNSAVSEEEFDAAYQAINKNMVEQAWNVPLFAGGAPFATADTVQFEPQADGGFPLWNFKPVA